MTGCCHLCGITSVLVDSHVWPKFAYKRFVANQSRGGSFIDLAKLRDTNRQYTRPWFCQQCDNVLLGGCEKYGASFCSRLEADPTTPIEYDERLLKFIVSISWRVSKYYAEDSPRHMGQSERDACKKWRSYLMKPKVSGVNPFSQHVFAVFDPVMGLHQMLGGYVFADENVVLSQVGPLFIVGLLGRKMSMPDLRIWRQSEVCSTGGVITPISEWREGKNVTREFGRLLACVEGAIKKRVVESEPIL